MMKVHFYFLISFIQHCAPVFFPHVSFPSDALAATRPVTYFSPWCASIVVGIHLLGHKALTEIYNRTKWGALHTPNKNTVLGPNLQRPKKGMLKKVKILMKIYLYIHSFWFMHQFSFFFPPVISQLILIQMAVTWSAAAVGLCVILSITGCHGNDQPASQLLLFQDLPLDHVEPAPHQLVIRTNLKVSFNYD